MKIRAVAFDLGNTLVEYYEREAFPSILSESIRNAYDVLSSFGAIPLERAQTIALTETLSNPTARCDRSKSGLIGFLLSRSKSLTLIVKGRAAPSCNQSSDALGNTTIVNQR
jgi:hypothetical protein